MSSNCPAWDYGGLEGLLYQHRLIYLYKTKTKIIIKIIEPIIDKIKVKLISELLVDGWMFITDWTKGFWILNPFNCKIWNPGSAYYLVRSF